jgi:hypothetical protein
MPRDVTGRGAAAFFVATAFLSLDKPSGIGYHRQLDPR